MPVTRNQSNAAAAAQAKSSSGVDAAGPSEADTEVPSEPARSDSPDNCSICLGPFNNKSFTSSCAHSFCFVCLKQWSKVKAECPLCKQPFTSIFHNIRSNQSYDIYDLPLNPTRQQPEYNITSYDLFTANASTGLPFAPFFMPELDADLTLGNFSRFQFRHNRGLIPGGNAFQNEHQYAFNSMLGGPHVNAASWPAGPEDFRRQVYRQHMGPPVTIVGAENSNYILTPAMVQASAHRIHRIMPWLTRELRVLLRSHQNVRLAISVIQPLLSQVMISSPMFRDRVTPLIGRRSVQFIREFCAFANSAMTLQQFDRKAMYRRRDSAATHTSGSLAIYGDAAYSSNSSSDDDVVEVTAVSMSGHPTSTNSMIIVPPTSAYQTDVVTSVNYDLPSSSGTQIEIQDDRVSVSSESDDPVFRPDQHDSDASRPGSDIVFLKYDKPWNERSPIRLSTDSDGDPTDERRSRKKKSKRKKRKESVSGRDKSHGKSLKSKSKGKSKSRVPAEGGDNESASSSHLGKRQRSSSPADRQKKKNKKSHDRSERSTGIDQDRDLVDRIFAEAFYSQSGSQASADGTDSVAGSSKDKRSKTSDKSKRKKKHKTRRRNSQSPSYQHSSSYKKHPSGHKKSSDTRHRPQDCGSERSRHHHRSAWTEVSAGQSSSQPDSAESMETQPSTHTASNYSLSMSSPAFHQSSYMTMPDTVQHIPLNLWVSTWPSLPHMSHAFPAGTTTAPSRPIATSPVMNPAGTSAPINTGVEHSPVSQTISSESDTSSSSDDDEEKDNSDDNQDTGPPGSSAASLAQTKEWLDSTFSVRSQPSSTITGCSDWSAQAIISAPSTAKDTVDVLTIESDDEECVVVSDSEGNDDVKVVDSEPPPTPTSTFRPRILRDKTPSKRNTIVEQCNSDPGPSSSRRVPPIRIKLNRFALSKKLPSTLNALNDSSDEEDPQPQTERQTDKETVTAETSQSSRDFLLPTGPISTTTAITCSSSEMSYSRSSQCTGSDPLSTLASTNLFPSVVATTTSTNPMFPVLPSLQPPSTVTSVLSSGLGYIPYGPISSNLSSVGYPGPPVTTSLPLAFSCLPPMLPPPPLLSSLYQPAFSADLAFTDSTVVSTTTNLAAVSSAGDTPANTSAESSHRFSVDVIAQSSATTALSEASHKHRVHTSTYPNNGVTTEPSISEIVNSPCSSSLERPVAMVKTVSSLLEVSSSTDQGHDLHTSSPTMTVPPVDEESQFGGGQYVSTNPKDNNIDTVGPTGSAEDGSSGLLCNDQDSISVSTVETMNNSLVDQPAQTIPALSETAAQQVTSEWTPTSPGILTSTQLDDSIPASDDAMYNSNETDSIGGEVMKPADSRNGLIPIGDGFLSKSHDLTDCMSGLETILHQTTETAHSSSSAQFLVGTLDPLLTEAVNSPLSTEAKTVHQVVCSEPHNPSLSGEQIDTTTQQETVM